MSNLKAGESMLRSLKMTVAEEETITEEVLVAAEVLEAAVIVAEEVLAVAADSEAREAQLQGEKADFHLTELQEKADFHQEDQERKVLQKGPLEDQKASVMLQDQNVQEKANIIC